MARNPVAAPAWLAVRAALKSGALVRATRCEDCGGTNKNPKRALCGHHEDYAKPLDVVWLCQPCHSLRHSELRKAA
jgi:hypothetical protein